MNKRATTYKAMMDATATFLVDTLGLCAGRAQNAITSASNNAAQCVVEDSEVNELEVFENDKDFDAYATYFISSLEGSIDYQYAERGDLTRQEAEEVSRGAEACAEAVLTVSTPPKPRKVFHVVVPAEIAEPTYIDCHDGGGYAFDQTVTNAALEALGLVEDPLFNFSGVEGDYDTICGYDDLLHVRFTRCDHAAAFANQLGLA